jgi:hypothetical protein
MYALFCYPRATEMFDENRSLPSTVMREWMNAWGRCAKTAASLEDYRVFPPTYQRNIILSDISRYSSLAPFSVTTCTAAIAAIPVCRESGLYLVVTVVR